MPTRAVEVGVCDLEAGVGPHHVSTSVDVRAAQRSRNEGAPLRLQRREVNVSDERSGLQTDQQPQVEGVRRACHRCRPADVVTDGRAARLVGSWSDVSEPIR